MYDAIKQALLVKLTKYRWYSSKGGNWELQFLPYV